MFGGSYRLTPAMTEVSQCCYIKCCIFIVYILFLTPRVITHYKLYNTQLKLVVVYAPPLISASLFTELSFHLLPLQDVLTLLLENFISVLVHSSENPNMLLNDVQPMYMCIYSIGNFPLFKNTHVNPKKN